MQGKAVQLAAGAGVAVTVGVEAVRRLRSALIYAYWFVVTVVICSSAALMLVAADARVSNWLSSCSMMPWGVFWDTTPWTMS